MVSNLERNYDGWKKKRVETRRYLLKFYYNNKTKKQIHGITVFDSDSVYLMRNAVYLHIYIILL